MESLSLSCEENPIASYNAYKFLRLQDDADALLTSDQTINMAAGVMLK